MGSFLRVVRVLRLIRVVRLMRILRLISELRTIVTSLAGSFKSFIWTVVLLLLLIYTVGIFFTQLVTDHRVSLGDAHEPEFLAEYFGSLTDTTLVLYQSILGGISWRAVAHPLMNEIGWGLGIVFSTYVTFCVLAIMNVVTGVFVESALNSARHDRDIYMVNSVRSLFIRAKIDMTGNLTWDEFESLLNSPEMEEYFKTIDVDISEAHGIFELLDIDGSGTLT